MIFISGSSEQNGDVPNKCIANVEITEESNEPLFNQKAQANKDIHKFAVGLTLCTCYCSKVGGMATLTGSPPNVIMKGQADEYVLDSRSDVFTTMQKLSNFKLKIKS